jgi:hypothetical protein
MPTILVNCRVPVRGPHEDSPLLFRQWIPRGNHDALEVEEGGFSVKLWIDESCLHPREPKTDELLAKRLNIAVSSVLVNVTARDVGSELASFIREYPTWREPSLDHPDPDVRRLAHEYQNLGRGVHAAVVKISNEVFSWAYANKGQYWVSKYADTPDMMMSDNNGFDAKVAIDGGPWSRWAPPNEDVMTIYNTGVERGIDVDNWQALSAELSGPHRPSLTGELLANAETLIEEGHFRGAVTEAAAALEVVFRQFARHPNVESLRPHASEPDALGALPHHVEHLGFSTSFRYLLPIIADSAALAASGHVGACQLVDLRQKIVHAGQRNVGELDVRQGVASVRKMVRLLRKWSRRPPRREATG